MRHVPIGLRAGPHVTFVADALRWPGLAGDVLHDGMEHSATTAIGSNAVACSVSGRRGLRATIRGRRREEGKEMIVVLFYVTVKAGREEQFVAMAKDVTQSTHVEDDGCINYAFYGRFDAPRDYVLYEVWRDADSLGQHLARLQRVFGPATDQEPFPPTHHRHRLPAKFLEFFERTEAVRYEPL